MRISTTISILFLLFATLQAQDYSESWHVLSGGNSFDGYTKATLVVSKEIPVVAALKMIVSGDSIAFPSFYLKLDADIIKNVSEVFFVIDKTTVYQSKIYTTEGNEDGLITVMLGEAHPYNGSNRFNEVICSVDFVDMIKRGQEIEFRVVDNSNINHDFSFTLKNSTNAINSVFDFHEGIYPRKDDCLCHDLFETIFDHYKEIGGIFKSNVLVLRMYTSMLDFNDAEFSFYKWKLANGIYSLYAGNDKQMFYFKDDYLNSFSGIDWRKANDLSFLYNIATNDIPYAQVRKLVDEGLGIDEAWDQVESSEIATDLFKNMYYALELLYDFNLLYNTRSKAPLLSPEFLGKNEIIDFVGDFAAIVNTIQYEADSPLDIDAMNLLNKGFSIDTVDYETQNLERLHDYLFEVNFTNESFIDFLITYDISSEYRQKIYDYLLETYDWDDYSFENFLEAHSPSDKSNYNYKCNLSLYFDYRSLYTLSKNGKGKNIEGIDGFAPRSIVNGDFDLFLQEIDEIDLSDDGNDNLMLRSRVEQCRKLKTQ